MPAESGHAESPPKPGLSKPGLVPLQQTVEQLNDLLNEYTEALAHHGGGAHRNPDTLLLELHDATAYLRDLVDSVADQLLM